MDTANQATLMLMDKGFYDYDYKVVEAPKKEVTLDDIPDYEATQRFLAGLGFGIYAKKDKPLKEMSIEEVQEYAVKQLNES